MIKHWILFAILISNLNQVLSSNSSTLKFKPISDDILIFGSICNGNESDPKCQKNFVEQVLVKPRVHGGIAINFEGQSDNDYTAYYDTSDESLRLLAPMNNNECRKIDLSNGTSKSIYHEIDIESATIMGMHYYYNLLNKSAIQPFASDDRQMVCLQFPVVKHESMQAIYEFEVPKNKSHNDWIDIMQLKKLSLQIDNESIWFESISVKKEPFEPDETIIRNLSTTIGTGCSRYVNESENIFQLITRRLTNRSLTFKEFVNGEIVVQDSFFSDITIYHSSNSNLSNTIIGSDGDSSYYSIIRQKASVPTQTDYIYDYNLGIRYVMRDVNNCTVEGIGPEEDILVNHFNLHEFLWIDKPFTYLGVFRNWVLKEFIVCEPPEEFLRNSEYITRVWESTNLVEKDNQTLKKVVTSIYITTKANERVGSSEDFRIFSQRKVYDGQGVHHITTERCSTESLVLDYHDNLRHYGCFNTEVPPVTLEFSLKPAINTTSRDNETHVQYQLPNIQAPTLDDSIRILIWRQLNISILRIHSIESAYIEGDLQISAIIFETIGSKAPLLTALKERNKSSGNISIDGLNSEIVSSEDACIRKFYNSDSIRFIIYCDSKSTSSDRKCIGLGPDDNIIASNSSSKYFCTLYSNRFSELTNFAKELPSAKLISTYSLLNHSHVYLDQDIFEITNLKVIYEQSYKTLIILLSVVSVVFLLIIITIGCILIELKTIRISSIPNECIVLFRKKSSSKSELLLSSQDEINT